MAEKQTEQAEVVVIPAKRSDKGFLRRQIAFEKARQANDLEELVRLTIEWCQVIVPDGVDPAEAIMDLSQDDFEAVMRANSGGAPAVDPPSDA